MDRRGLVSLVLTVLVVFFGFGIVSAIFGDAYQYPQLKEEGIETDRIVTRKWNESRKTMHYHVAYEFSTGGQRCAGKPQFHTGTGRHSPPVRI
jgi:hypothetical protein